MSGNMHVDELAIVGIHEGMVRFELGSAGKVFHFCMSVGRYRSFIAGAANQLDAWIAEQSAPVRMVAGARH